MLAVLARDITISIILLYILVLGSTVVLLLETSLQTPKAKTISYLHGTVYSALTFYFYYLVRYPLLVDLVYSTNTLKTYEHPSSPAVTICRSSKLNATELIGFEWPMCSDTILPEM